jgi:phage shock protein PspC (stress-responsive transcriptional regulator)
MLDNIGLYRSRHDRWIFGVCGGIARKFQINTTLVRLAVVLLALVVPGVSFVMVAIAYLALGLLLPESDTY